MGFLDSIKKATRIGLSNDQFYNLAFEEGVFLSRWADAANLFGQAAVRFQQQGNATMMHRALANQALYLYALAHQEKATPDRLKYIQAAIPHLQVIPEIEVLGSQTDGMPTQTLLDELLGYMHWIHAESADDMATKAQQHTDASRCFENIGDSTLVFERQMSAKEPYFFNLACATYYQAHLIADSDPNAAVEKLQEAYNSFHNCSIHSDLADKVLDEINELATRETCWFCGREVQGNELHFRYYPYHATPYVHQVFDALPVEGKPTMLPDHGIPLCVICGSAFESLAEASADRRIAELRNELANQLSVLTAKVNQLAEGVANLQRVAHHH